MPRSDLKPLPDFPREEHCRLLVEVGGRAPEPAMWDDLVSACREFEADDRAALAREISPELVERLERAELVIEAMADAKLAMKRLEEYRATYPQESIF